MKDSEVHELQVKVAFLEDSLSKLSDEFYLQQREFEQLKAKYSGLVDKVRGLQSDKAEQAQIEDERPPHY